MDVEGKPDETPGEVEIPFSEALKLSVRREGNAHVVTLRGATHLGEAEELNAQLSQLIQPAYPHLILDMSELEFLGSVGLNAIVTAHNRARTFNGRVSVVNPKPEVANLLSVTRVDQLASVFPTLEAARQAPADTQT